jgi:hypothetical protein
MSQPEMNFNLVLAHGPCADGAVSACIYLDLLPEETIEALEKLGGFFKREPLEEEPEILLRGESDPTGVEACVTAEPVPNVPKVCFIAPQTHLPDALVCGARVLLLDLDMGKELELLIERAAFVLHIDHHKSGEPFVNAAREKFAADRYVSIFKMDVAESAASLTWQYFHRNETMPLIVRFAQIGDTWNWKQLGDAFDVKAILTNLYSRRAFSSMTAIFNMIGWRNGGVLIETGTFRELERIGKIQEEYQKIMVAKIAGQYHKASVMCVSPEASTIKYDILLVNCPFSLISEVGNHLGKIAEALQKERSHPAIHFCAVYTYNFTTDTVHVSLRAPADAVDLSAVAKSIHGSGVKTGGGHPAAAGFTIAGIDNFNNIFIRNVLKE